MSAALRTFPQRKRAIVFDAATGEELFRVARRAMLTELKDGVTVWAVDRFPVDRHYLEGGKIHRCRELDITINDAGVGQIIRLPDLPAGTRVYVDLAGDTSFEAEGPPFTVRRLAQKMIVTVISPRHQNPAVIALPAIEGLS